MDQAAADLLRPYFVAWCAVLGAALGSFLNVVIARVPHGRSIVRPGSACPRCGAGIAWYDNVPVLSWLFLRARCRACRAPISARYPLVEALVAGLATLAAVRHGPSPEAFAELAFVALLVALAFIDLDTWLLPWSLSFPLAGLGLLAGGLGLTPAGGLLPATYGALAGFALFGLIHLVGEKVLHKEALAFGDVVLLAGLCAWFGPRGLLPIILLSSLQGAAVGVTMLALGRTRLGPESAAERAAAAALEAPTHPPPEGPHGAVEVTPAEPPAPAPEAVEAPAASAEDDDDDWVPDPHHIPYGPFLALAALEWLYLAEPLARAVPAFGLFLGG